MEITTDDGLVTEKMGNLYNAPTKDRGEININEKITKIKVKNASYRIYGMELHGNDGKICATLEGNSGEWKEIFLPEDYSIIGVYGEYYENEAD